jgi:hypothetical protein
VSFRQCLHLAEPLRSAPNVTVLQPLCPRARTAITLVSSHTRVCLCYCDFAPAWFAFSMRRACTRCAMRVCKPVCAAASPAQTRGVRQGSGARHHGRGAVLHRGVRGRRWHDASTGPHQLCEVRPRSLAHPACGTRTPQPTAPLPTPVGIAPSLRQVFGDGFVDALRGPLARARVRNRLVRDRVCRLPVRDLVGACVTVVCWCPPPHPPHRTRSGWPGVGLSARCRRIDDVVYIHGKSSAGFMRRVRPCPHPHPRPLALARAARLGLRTRALPGALPRA